ncbi:MAG: hypothetical protein PHZ02_14720 [Desulfocapsaceae bacterium]|nr:hypothetical protein [Desulfocapsaceae bacterium]
MNKSKLFETCESAVRFCVWLTILLTFGCATYGPNLVKEGTMTVETVNAKDIRLSNIGVYQKDGGTIVNGHIQRRRFSYFMPSGYVQVEMISPDGTRHQQCERYLGGYGKSKRHGTSFVTEFPFIPVQGTVVRLSVHNLTSDKDLRCNE